MLINKHRRLRIIITCYMRANVWNSNTYEKKEIQLKQKGKESKSDPSGAVNESSSFGGVPNLVHSIFICRYNDLLQRLLIQLFVRCLFYRRAYVFA
jgi:hypothetical protein